MNEQHVPWTLRSPAATLLAVTFAQRLPETLGRRGSGRVFTGRVRFQVLFVVRAKASVSLRSYAVVSGHFVAAAAEPDESEAQEVCGQGVRAEARKRHGNAVGLQVV